MKIKSIGGEFGLIQLIRKEPKRRSVLVGIGDDAAVVKPGNRLLVLTTDLLVEGDHFRLDWSTPRQVGIKAMECNVSDVAAMNARPLYALVSVCLKRDASVEFVRELYAGINSVARKYEVDIIGGDFTHGEKAVVNVAVVGEAESNLCLRKNARPGDAIFVSGNLGASAAGLALLLKKARGFQRIKIKHLEPRAKLGKALRIGKIANAMEDVSDGLASEVRNICFESKCGAEIFAEKVPVAADVKRAGKKLGKSALDWAFFGGEDFELVFTVPPNKVRKARRLGKEVGRIVAGKKIFLVEKGKKRELKKVGYDHFS